MQPWNTRKAALALAKGKGLAEVSPAMLEGFADLSIIGCDGRFRR